MFNFNYHTAQTVSKPIKIKLLFFSILFLLAFNGATQEIGNEKGEKLSSDVNESAGKDYISVYQKYISGIRGNDCPMFPSCSNYAISEIGRKGFIKGTISGIDRLLRCSHEINYYPRVLTQQGSKILDSGISHVDDSLQFTKELSFYPFQVNYQDTTLALISILTLKGLHNEALTEVYKLKIKGIKSLELSAYELLLNNALKRYNEVLFLFEYTLSEDEKLYPNIYKQYLTAQYKQGNFRNIIALTANVQNSTDTSLKNYFNLLAINAYLKTRDIDGLTQYESKYLKVSNYTQQLLETKRQISGIPKKSPFIAGFSSALVPGSGYIYSGHTMTGISSLLFNSLFAFATFSSFRANNPGMGILTGLFGMAFYVANIQGSVKSAKRFNVKNYENLIKKFEINSIIYH